MSTDDPRLIAESVCPECGAPTEVVVKMNGPVRLPTCDCLAEKVCDEFFARLDQQRLNDGDADAR
jgi:hypothetical protein